MNVVIAIDSFKGSMTSLEAGESASAESGAYIRMQISPSAHLQTVAKARWKL